MASIRNPGTWAAVLVGIGAAVGCGGSSTDGTFPGDPDASAGGGSTATGGKGGASGSGTGGASKGAGGSGTGAGGLTGGTGGGLGTGGRRKDKDAGACPAPAAGGGTRLCVTFSPEAITARADGDLDKQGVLIVQVFDTPTPPDKDADKIALAQRIEPPGALLGGDAGVGAEIGVDDLREIRFEKDFPATVYVRALFVDNPSWIGSKKGPIGYGVWLGGVNLDDGIQDKDPLLPVPLVKGAGNALDLSLTALRRLRVTVSRTATPVGDGKGPLGVVVVNRADPATKPPLFGLAQHGCADSAAPVTVNGFVIGTGPRYVTAVLNDLGTPGDLPPGSLVSLDVKPASVTFPTQLTYGATDYVVSTAFNLNYLVPYGPDAGPIPPNTCADIAGGDAGAP